MHRCQRKFCHGKMMGDAARCDSQALTASIQIPGPKLTHWTEMVQAVTHQDCSIALTHSQQGCHDELEEDETSDDLVHNLTPHLQTRCRGMSCVIGGIQLTSAA